MKRFRITTLADTTSHGLDYEKELNREQYSVVMNTGGPMLVLAGAGTGKTRTVTYRVARLIEIGNPPSGVLLLTFTNKAAREMMQRVQGLIGSEIRGLWGGTFHHIGNLLLRRHAGLLGYKEGFSILDREDQKELLRGCLDEVKGQERLLPRGAVLAAILSYHKNTMIPVEDIINLRYSHLLETGEDIIKIMNLYGVKKHRLNLMDFDDLLINTLRLLEEYPELRDAYSARFRHILVDEYQDTNILQARLVDILASAHGNVMVVGDDAQSIYSFRGARTENILGFPERYPGTTIFKLTTNYRSTPEVLELANESISKNLQQFHKQLSSVKQSGEKPMVVPLGDLYEQAEFVASRIIEIVNEDADLEGIAILYRSHYQSMEVQIELQRRGIPFEVRSGLKFFEQAHIKDIISFLRVLLNPYDELSWKRTLKMTPNIGNVTAHKVWEFISSKKAPLEEIKDAVKLIPGKAVDRFSLFVSTIEGVTETGFREEPADAISYILEHMYEGYLYNTYPNAESRYEDIEQLIRYAHRYSADTGQPNSGLERLISDLTLEAIQGNVESQEEATVAGRVILSSVHQAKGLEWRHVFIIGLNDGRFPSKKALMAEEEEEERRLFYVACTRAMDELYLCYPLTDDGSSGFTKASRFLKELPGSLYDEVEVIKQ